MAEKEEKELKSYREKVKDSFGLTPKDLKLLEKRFSRDKHKTVAEIARALGICEKTYYNRMKKIEKSGFLDEVQRVGEKLKQSANLMYAGYIYHILRGNYEPIHDGLKMFGFLKERISVEDRRTLTDDELVEGMKTAIVTALRDKKAGKHRKTLPEPEKSSGAPGKRSIKDITDQVQVSEEKTEFNGEGIA